MDKHNQRFAAMSNAARRVKIEQNHTWRLRLLPVQMGPDKEPFIDIAQHWWNKSPITCPKHTGEAWGGNPDFPCPVCEISERLSNSSSEEINSIGYRVRCNLRVRSWCVVFDMEDRRGVVDEMPINEILNPYEFDMFKTVWEQFSKYQKWARSGRRAGQEASEYGILDLETGCDLLATQGAKGITLDRCDPGPIFPLDDANYDNYIKKIWSHIRKPHIIIPTEKQLLEVAVKIEEYAERGGVSRRRGRDDDDDRGRGRGRGRHSDDDDDGGFRGRGRSRYGEDNDDDSPSRSRRSFSRGTEDDDAGGAPATARRHAPEPQPEPESAESATTPPPTRRAAPTSRAAAPERQPEPEQAPEGQEEAPLSPPTRRTAAGQQPPTRRTAPPAEEASVTSEEMEQDQNPDPAPPPPARRGTRPAAPPSARHTEPAETDAAPEQQPPARRAAATAAPAAAGVDEEEDNVPDEQRDPAPPVRQKVAEDAPPKVAATGPAPRRVGDTSAIRDRLDKLTQKGR